MHRAILLSPVVVLLFGFSISVAAEQEGIRGPALLLTDPTPPPFPREDVEAERRVRTFHEQPPIIPHSIRDYQLDRRANQCLTCHGRTGTSDSPLSIAHFLDRDGRASASVAPGHYFCTQCHVTQTASSPPVGNSYQVLATVPFHRHLCNECHLPQTGMSSAGASLREGRDHAR
jgi:nitrate reductase (cytochrome), electron transfer subunit